MSKKRYLILLSAILICLVTVITLQIYSVVTFKSEKKEKTNQKEQPNVLLDESTDILAGVSEVEGSGITITVADSKESMFNDPEISVIHDEDVLSLINELYDAEAEAVSVNGERIVATSEIRCAGSTISINNNRYSEPYIIKAIGNPDNMKNALLMNNGIAETLSYYGIDVEIEESDKLTVEAYKGSKNFKYAKPVK